MKYAPAVMRPSDASADQTPPIRLGLIQLTVPHYRVAVFDRLAADPRLDVTVLADTLQADGSLTSAADRGRFRTEQTPWRRRGGFILQPGMVAAARSGRFDVLLLPWNTRILHLFPALRESRRRGVGTILFGHGYSKKESTLRRRLRNAALSRAGAALLYNTAARDRLLEEGIAATKLHVALNAIDQAPIQVARESWRGSPERLNAFRRQHGLAGRELVLFVSRLEPDKRVDLLIEAFARLRATHPSARLAIVGDGSLRASLEALAQRRGLGESAIFPGAIFDEAELAPWMLCASAFAYPVAIGLSILHAFGYGVPVVTSDDFASHNPEIEALRPGENGLLYREDDIADFAAKLELMLTGGAWWETMSRAARETVVAPDGFTLDGMVRGMTEAILAVARRGHASP